VKRGGLPFSPLLGEAARFGDSADDQTNATRAARFLARSASAPLFQSLAGYRNVMPVVMGKFDGISRDCTLRRSIENGRHDAFPRRGYRRLAATSSSFADAPIIIRALTPRARSSPSNLSVLARSANKALSRTACAIDLPTRRLPVLFKERLSSRDRR